MKAKIVAPDEDTRDAVSNLHEALINAVAWPDLHIFTDDPSAANFEIYVSAAEDALVRYICFMTDDTVAPAALRRLLALNLWLCVQQYRTKPLISPFAPDTVKRVYTKVQRLPDPIYVNRGFNISYILDGTVRLSELICSSGTVRHIFTSHGFYDVFQDMIEKHGQDVEHKHLRKKMNDFLKKLNELPQTTVQSLTAPHY